VLLTRSGASILLDVNGRFPGVANAIRTFATSSAWRGGTRPPSSGLPPSQKSLCVYLISQI